MNFTEYKLQVAQKEIQKRNNRQRQEIERKKKRKYILKCIFLSSIIAIVMFFMLNDWVNNPSIFL